MHPTPHLQRNQDHGADPHPGQHPIHPVRPEPLRQIPATRDKTGRPDAGGDEILRSLGKLLLEHVRGEDMPCRCGGDEFIIVMPDSSEKTLRERAELLCELAHHIPVPLEGQFIGNVTLSLGVAIFPRHGSTSTDILKAADDALYRAKDQGRDRVALAILTPTPHM